MGFILYLISLLALIVSAIWTPIKLVWYILTFWRHRPLKDLNKWFYYRAEILDVYGNHTLSILFNRTMIKGNGKFRFTGVDRDTISYTLAVNQKLGTLTPFGKFWVRFLEKVDPGHMDRALINKERRYTQWQNPIKDIK